MFLLGLVVGFAVSSYFWYEFWHHYDFIDRGPD